MAIILQRTLRRFHHGTDSLAKRRSVAVDNLVEEVVGGAD